MSVQESECCRSLQSIVTSVKMKPSEEVSKRLGSKHPSLLNIEPEDIAIDILHLMLRITDILLRKIIFKMTELDRQKRKVTELLDKLVSTIRSESRIIISLLSVIL